MRIKIYIVLQIFITFPLLGQAQTMSEYPVSFLHTAFNTFIQSHELRNIDSSKINFSSYVRKNTGLFADVYQTKSQVGFNVNRSTISMQMYSDHQGELINRSRLYVNTNTHITIYKNIYAFVGLSGGIVKKSLGNQNTNIQGTASVFDASATVGLYGKQWMIVLSACQIPQRTITPISFEVPLLKYYQMYGTASTKLNQNLTLDGMVMTTLYEKQIPEVILGVETTWKQNYRCGIEFSNYNLANYFIDFRVKKISKCSIYMLMGYETNHRFSNHLSALLSIFNAGFILKWK